MMNTWPLQLRDGHLFVELNGDLWLLDTGALTSFGASRNLTIAGEQFSPDTSYLGIEPTGLITTNKRKEGAV